MSTLLTTGKHKKRVKEFQNAARQYNGQKGTVYIHMVTFDDGSVGEFHSSKDTNTKFIAGQEIEFECEVKVQGQYTNYKIKPVDTGGGFRGNGSPAVDTGMTGKWHAATESLRWALDSFNANKITKEQIVASAQRNYTIISELVNGKS